MEPKEIYKDVCAEICFDIVNVVIECDGTIESFDVYMPAMVGKPDLCITDRLSEHDLKYIRVDLQARIDEDLEAFIEDNYQYSQCEGGLDS